jgi:hypothetical protein
MSTYRYKALQCKALSKRTHERCLQPAMIGRKLCYHHGGKNLRGTASPQYRHGKYSMVLPARLKQRYEEALADQDLLSLKHEIASVDARLADAYQRLDSGESGATWAELATAERDLRRALQADDRPRQVVALAAMRDLVTQGSTTWAASKEVRELEDHRRKLIDTEQRLLLLKEQTVSVTELNVLLGVILDSITTHVSTTAEPAQARRILNAISDDFDKYTRLGEPGPRIAPARPARRRRDQRPA